MNRFRVSLTFFGFARICGIAFQTSRVCSGVVDQLTLSIRAKLIQSEEITDSRHFVRIDSYSSSSPPFHSPPPPYFDLKWLTVKLFVAITQKHTNTI